MTIPILCLNPNLPKAEAEGGSTLDIAPTVSIILGAAPDPDWEGKPLGICED